MSSSNLSSIRAALAAKTQKPAGSTAFVDFYENFYPFFNQAAGTEAVLRLVTDADPDNHLQIYVENFSHELFINGKKKVVPCMKMYGHKNCPACDAKNEYYAKEGENTVNGRKLLVKKNYLFQGLVIQSPFEFTPKNPDQVVFLFNIGSQIFNKFNTEIGSSDMDGCDPFSYTNGLNFITRKAMKGNYADFSGSSFARRETSLDKETIAKVESQKFRLSDYRVKEIDMLVMKDFVEQHKAGVSSGGTPTPTPTVKATVKAETSLDDELANIAAVEVSQVVVQRPVATPEPVTVAETSSSATMRAAAVGMDIKNRIANRPRVAS